MATEHPSLEKGSKASYFPAQIRKASAGTVRLQILPKTEFTVTVSPKLVDYVSTLPQPNKSVAGTGALYAVAQVRPVEVKLSELVGPDDKPAPVIEGVKATSVKGIKVQVPGPEYNRPWGAEFVLCSIDMAAHGKPQADDDDGDDDGDDK
jgi:hypothetical protein